MSKDSRMNNDEIWIVDDDKSIRWVLEKVFSRQNLAHRSFESADTALAELPNTQPSVIFSDIRMPGNTGFDLLQTLQADFSEIPVIIMTAYSDLDSTVSAFQSGAFEYLTKPFDLEKIIDIAKRALEHYRSSQNIESTSAENIISSQDFIGASDAIQKVFHAIGRLSQSSISVLITGESGTGKELIAKALHSHSPRAKKPFIAINAAAIPKDLLESELFGHEKGAFTGAHAQRKGRFEQAAGGTLFLDEIGDMPADLQTRLLRVLSDGCFYRIGGQTSIQSDVRIIAATHQNLLQRVEDNHFREDLYHRLNVINIHSPALRERPEDIPLLLEYFLQLSAKELKVDCKVPDDEVIKCLQALSWSGNIRQLENTARWLTVMVSGKEITSHDLPDDLLSKKAKAKTEIVNWEQALANYTEQRFTMGDREIMNETTPAYEKIMIKAALEHTGGKKKEAADLLGLSRNTLTRKLSALKI